MEAAKDIGSSCWVWESSNCVKIPACPRECRIGAVPVPVGAAAGACQQQWHSMSTGISGNYLWLCLLLVTASCWKPTGPIFWPVKWDSGIKLGGGITCAASPLPWSFCPNVWSKKKKNLKTRKWRFSGPWRFGLIYPHCITVWHPLPLQLWWMVSALMSIQWPINFSAQLHAVRWSACIV